MAGLTDSTQLQQFVKDKEVVGLCVSGGLDSKTVALRMKKQGVNVICFTADIGQPDEEDINDVVKKMAPCGVETVIVDLKEDMAEACFDCVLAQAKYDGGYWQSTGIGRYVTCRGLIQAMKERKVTVLSHGATGRGNDQLRFERYTNVLDPHMKVYAPWRDAQLLQDFAGRAQMLEYLQKNDIGHSIVSSSTKRYSTDANMAGLSNEAEDLESLETAMTIVQPVMGVWPHDDKAVKQTVVMRFEEGRCVQLATGTKLPGSAMSPVQVMELANKLAGQSGIGLVHALENRVLGTKSRGVYESPGMELLGRGLELVYQAVLDRRSSQLFKYLSAHVSDQIYDGRYFDPSTQASMTGIRHLAQAAKGTITLELYRGNMYFLALTDCPHSVYVEADASMEASEGLNPVSSQGFCEVCSVEAKALANANLIKSNTRAKPY